MFDKQTRKFCSAVIEALPSVPEAEMQQWIGNPRGLQKALGSIFCPQEAPPAPKESPLDTIIRVDRSARLVYPRFAKLVHPELERVGPAEYDLSRIELYLTKTQRDSDYPFYPAVQIYNHLKGAVRMRSCLGLHDAMGIRDKGTPVFQKLFLAEAIGGIVCWRSVVRRFGIYGVPVVRYDSTKVTLIVEWWWCWYGISWDHAFPAGRFAS